MAVYIPSDILTSIPLILLLVGLTLAVWFDPYILQARRRLMLLIILLLLVLVVRDVAEVQMTKAGNMIFGRTITAMVGYIIRPVIIVLFCRIVNPGKSYAALWGLTVVNALIYLTALFSRVCFWIDVSNRFYRGPLGYTCHVVSAVALVYLVWLTLRTSSREGRKTHSLLPMFNAAIIILSVVLDSFIFLTQGEMSLLTITMVVCCLLYYIWLHQQFEWEHKQALLAEQRMQIMLSQIQPHFLYNTLSTIQALCRIDPEKAFYTTEKFGMYLRQNLDSLNRTDMIPIRKELEHTRAYSEIEELRFPNVHVEYDAQDMEFMLPPLTIQPLVENAIRHGVRIRENGVVTVSTRRLEHCHEITVRDNGGGFDTGILEGPGEGHIGIRNVKDRIENLCRGTFELKSVIGEGTTITVQIPF